MSNSDIYITVKTFLIEEIEIEESIIIPDARLKEDLGIESLDFVDIIVIVEKHFGFKIKPDEMNNVKTLQQFCDYIESKIK
ncbi:hypothetical protein FACS1894153_2360 [Bacteroidia bacterium]|nr:hypothetical protein FACS1894153_2360 [Bacteroidia bacterium]